jgi:S1-C subfamily serine protease
LSLPQSNQVALKSPFGLFSLQVDFISVNKFQNMMTKAVREINKGMFPIFSRVVKGHQVTLSSIGSGFFINKDGVFVTTAHLFDSVTPQIEYLYCGLLPDNLQNPPMQIREIARDNAADIYVGRIDLQNTNFLKFTDARPEVGKTVCIAGYPLPNITLNNQGGFDLGGVRRYFQPSFILDKAHAPTVNSWGVARRHTGFAIRDFGLFGMSGGPVVDINGHVLGMQASITDPRDSTNGIRTITVQNAVAIENSRIIELLQENNIAITIEHQQAETENPE